MEDYVTFEQAKALKELGFDWECNHYYQDTDQSLHINFYENFNKHNKLEYTKDEVLIKVTLYSAPTLSQTAKWLREVKGIYVDIFLNASGYGWELDKTKPIYETNGTRLQKYDFKGEHEDSGMWLTYEKALLAGIDAALELLK